MEYSRSDKYLNDVGKVSRCSMNISKTARKLLKFRICQDDEGIWVKCEECDMWRYVHDIRDPVEVSGTKFFCKTVAKECNGPPDDGSDQLFYETKFTAGSLVWARRPNGLNMNKWLWWPAIVEDSSDCFSQYFLIDPLTNQPVAYHVTYLDALRSGAWLRTELLKPFKLTTNVKSSHSLIQSDARFSLQEAVERASNATRFNIRDRIENFSFLAHAVRFEKGVRDPPTADLILNGLVAPNSCPERNADSSKEVLEMEKHATLKNVDVLKKKQKYQEKKKPSSKNYGQSPFPDNEKKPMSKKTPKTMERDAHEMNANVRITEYWKPSSAKKSSTSEALQEPKRRFGLEQKKQAKIKSRKRKDFKDTYENALNFQQSSQSFEEIEALFTDSKSKRSSQKTSNHDSGLESFSETSFRADTFDSGSVVKTPKSKKKNKSH